LGSTRSRVPGEVRTLDDAHLRALAGSIALRGMLVSVVVGDDGDGFELVAGFTASPASDSLRGRNARRQVAKLMAAAEWDVIEGVAP
jgi:hypothetical protein